MTRVCTTCGRVGWLFLLIWHGLGSGWVVGQVGPMVGTVDQEEAWFLYRPEGDVEKAYRLVVMDGDGREVGVAEGLSEAVNDHVAKFRVGGLRADTAYGYRVEEKVGVVVAGPGAGCRFRTSAEVGARGVVTAAFLSCADVSSEPVYERIGVMGVDRLFLCGDTPYIDSTDLAVIRAKHRAYLSTPRLAELIRRVPTVGIWDDHDFGLNNGNGLSFAAHKEKTRKAFVEYRAHDRYGDGVEGVYHKVDMGLMEVFLLDPRWFSQTGAAGVNPLYPTCFGGEQWRWLVDGLAASRAPFKVLAMGQVWQDKKNGETDDMFTYWPERDALLDFVRDRGISGVVLVGGDIHVSRHLVHRQRVGYDLHDFVTSPAHTGIIPSLDVAHPDLEWSLVEGRQFLTLTADTRSAPPVLTARYLRHDGSVAREVVLPYDRMVPRVGSGLGKGLRAWWDFEGGFANRSVMGARLDAVSVNGAGLVAEGGLRGGAAGFSRAASQYLRVGRSALDDNSAGHSVSMWCKAAGLPAHGSGDRQFLLESTLGGEVGAAAGYTLSLGFRAAGDGGKVNLELYTQTVRPAVGPAAAPTAVVQGPFPCELERGVFAGRWVHVAFTFEVGRLRLYVDGEQVAEHVLVEPGPAAEHGGLVMGGHREGEGRNFDGMLDEVALWSRVLEAGEVKGLWNGGKPGALPVEVADLDGDGDGMEDWWERMCRLDPADPRDGLADADGDGVPAFLEREAWTDPLGDDRVLYERLRRAAGVDGGGEGLVFRDPASGLLRVRMVAGVSDGLGAWRLVDGGEGWQVFEVGGGIEFRWPMVAEGRQFVRFALQP